MGPAAWAAVGRALATALATSLLKGESSIIVLAAKQIQSVIAANELELAHAMLRDLAFRHREAFEQFMKDHGSELTPEILEELRQV